MSQLQEEIEKLEDTLEAFPNVLKQARTDVGKQSAVSVELSNTASVMDPVRDNHYDVIKKYAEQRALIIEDSKSRLDFYDISDGSNWSGLSVGVTFPTASEFIVYGFLEDNTPVTFDSNYYIIEESSGVLASQTSISSIIQPPDQYVIPDYTLTDVVSGGANHVKISFDTALQESPRIGDRFAMISTSTNELVGYIEVGIEGLGFNSDWDAVDPSVDVTNQTQLENWFNDMLDITNSDFNNIVGPFTSSGFPDDDIIKSANPDNQSTSQAPYTEIEKSPFFPALNDDESDWPDDFESVDTKNRKLVINSDPKWAVYPKFRWEGRLIPNISSSVYSEDLPGTFFGTQKIDDLQAISINQTDFPINVSGSDPITYTWDQATDKIYETADSTTTLYPCTYNSLTDFIAEWNSGLGPFVSSVLSDWDSYSNPIDSGQQTSDQTFVDALTNFQDLMNSVITHHDSWFDSSDDNNTTTFDSDIGDYDQSFVNNMKNALTSEASIFDDRVAEISGIIGDAQNKTGYVGPLIAAVNLIVHRGYGFLNDLLGDSSGLNNIKETLKRVRQKYDAYTGS